MNLSMHAIKTAGTLRRNPRWVVGSRRAPAPPRSHTHAGREPLALAGPGAEPRIGCGRRSALGNTRAVHSSTSLLGAAHPGRLPTPAGPGRLAASYTQRP